MTKKTILSEAVSKQVTETVRASSWPRLFDCPHAWEGIAILRLPNYVGLRAVMGTALHAGTAVFDQGRIDGAGITPLDAADVVIDKLHDPGDFYRPVDGDPSMRKAEITCTSLITKYCIDWSPHYEWESVELTTKPLDIDCGGGVIIRLTGSLDRSRVRKHTVDGKSKRGIHDIKSGAAAVGSDGVAVTKQHKPQLGTYTILAEHTTGLPFDDDSGIIGMKTKGTPTIGEGVVRGAKEAMLGTDDSPGLIEYAADMLRLGRFPPNPSSIMCGPKYCPRWNTCKFHQ